MMFRVLGPLEIGGGGGSVRLNGPRPRALVTALLLQPNAVVSSSRLIDAIWEDDPPEAPSNALQQVVARFRRDLGDLAPHLRTASGGYALVVPEGSLDADLFEIGCREARQCAETNPRKAAALFDDALALWRGRAYDEYADRFAGPASARLEELRTAAVEDRTALHLALGEYVEVVAAARALSAAEPLRERPVALLMRALHLSGRTPDALEAFRTHRVALAEELGLDPSAELRELETRILQDDVEPPGAVTAPPTARRRSSLPLPTGELFGRERDLRLVRESLKSSPVVTVVGPGGVGKTRLALEVATALERHGREVWWVDVTTVPADRVLDAIAEGSGSEFPGGSDPMARLAASLSTTPGILVVDNAESVLDALAPAVERLAADVPDLRILLTSRERLAVVGEHVHLLTPLPPPSGPERDNPAIRLFLERAPHLIAADVGEDELADIADLCRGLDGLPLAIELGAARAVTFGIRQFGAQVAAGIDLLAGGRRTAPERHRTLRAVVDTSWALLTAEEALLLARLSVLPARFDLEQARVVCADGDLPAAMVGGHLARLVEQSLVQAGQGRFWLLETLRTYAGERLRPDDRARLLERHARHTAHRLAVLSWQHAPTTEPEVVAQLSAMTPDLYQAWDHAVREDRDLAVELAAAISGYAYPRQRRDLLDWGRVVAEWETTHPLLPRAYATAAAAAWAAGDLNEAERLALAGLAAGEGPDDPATAGPMVQAGNLAMFAGRHEEAMECYRAARTLFDADGEPLRALMAEISVCQVLTYAGRHGEALDGLVDLTRRARATGNPSVMAWAHFVTGEAQSPTDPDAAMRSYRAALEEGRRSDHRLYMALARSSAVALAARSGPPAAALDEFERVIDEWSELRNEAAQWHTLLHLTKLLLRLGSFEDAAVVAGAVWSARDRQAMWETHRSGLEADLEALRSTLGAGRLDELSGLGAALGVKGAVARSREAIHAARDRLGVTPRMS